MSATVPLLASQDAVVSLLARALAHQEWTLTVDGPSTPLQAQLSHTEYGMRRFQFFTRTASPTLERVMEILALSQWRYASGAWSPTTGILIRIPRLPVRLDAWEQTLDVLVKKPLGPIVEATTMPWALCSERGGFVLRLPGLFASAPDGVDRTGAAPVPRVEMPQADVHLAVLKILLAQTTDTPHGWWGGPRIPLTTGMQLAKVAGASSSAVYALLEALAKRDWIRGGAGREFHLDNVPAVVTWWLDRAKHQRRSLIAVRPLYATGSLTAWAERQQWLRSQAALRRTARWAISGWAACYLHGLSVLLHPEAKPFVLTTKWGPLDGPEFLHAWQLVPCDARDAIFWIDPTPEHRSALVGVRERDGLPVVDAWQAALDVASDLDRGIEQATAIADQLWLTT